jgi:hypothetical protein
MYVVRRAKRGVIVFSYPRLPHSVSVGVCVVGEYCLKPCKKVDYNQPSVLGVSEAQSRTAERGKVDYL